MKKINILLTSALSIGIVVPTITSIVSCSKPEKKGPIVPESKTETIDSNGRARIYCDLEDKPVGEIEAEIVKESNLSNEGVDPIINIDKVMYDSNIDKAIVELFVENWQALDHDTDVPFSILFRFETKSKSIETQIDGFTVKCLQFDKWHDSLEWDMPTIAAFDPGDKEYTSGEAVVNEYFEQAKTTDPGLDLFVDDVMYSLNNTLGYLVSEGKVDLSGGNDHFMVNIHKIDFTDDRKANFTIEFDVKATKFTTIAPWKRGNEITLTDVDLKVTYVIENGVLNYQVYQDDSEEASFTKFDMTAEKPFHGHITGTCKINDKLKVYNDNWKYNPQKKEKQDEVTTIGGSIAWATIFDPENEQAQGTLRSSYLKKVKYHSNSVGTITINGKDVDAGSFEDNHICDATKPIVLGETSYPRNTFNCDSIHIKKFPKSAEDELIEIPDNFFAGCEKLTQIEDLDHEGISVNKIGNNYYKDCLYGPAKCGKLSADLSQLQWIGDNFFWNYGAKKRDDNQNELEIPNSIIHIGANFLYNTPINYVNFHDWSLSDMKAVFSEESYEGDKSFCSNNKKYCITKIAGCTEEAFNFLKEKFYPMEQSDCYRNLVYVSSKTPH